jgi:hypothetical protein
MTRTITAAIYVVAILSIGAVAAASASAALPEFSGPFPKAFTSTSKASTLETVGKTKVKCEADTNAGTITGPNAGNLTITFTGCQTKTIPCNSPGAVPGEIVTHGLTSTLGYINRELKEVGIDFSNPAGALVLEFQCGPATAGVVRGSVIGKITPVNKLVKPPAHFTVKFAQKKGIQTIGKFEAGPLDILETSLNGGPFEPSGLNSVDLVKFAAPPVEIFA